MASERIHNEYDAVRIANGLDTLAENLAGYEAGTPVTPTDAMKAKLPSQSTGDRISDAMEGLAQGLTNISHPQRISYDDWNALTPQEKANGTQYYIYDYPSVDGSLYAPVTSVATPENGNTASKAYAVGEMFIRGGKLCTCLVAIAQGGTFVKDTNYKEGDVGSVLTELNSKISKNDITQKIDIKPYNSSSNVYTFPSDGYVRLYAEANNNITLVMYGRSKAENFSLVLNGLTSPEVANAFYVKAGMHAYVRSTTTDTVAQFMPLV